MKLIRLKFILAFFFLGILFFSSLSTQGAELEEILQRGKLIIAVKDNLRPLGFMDRQGKLQGFEIEIARGLAREVFGNSEAVVFRPVTNQERLPMVIDGQVDLAIASVSITPSRSRLVDFSPAYYLDGTGMITNKPALTQLQNLTTSKIGVLEGSSAIAVIRSELPNARLVGVTSYQEAFYRLESGEIDAFSGDNSVLAGWVQEYPSYHQLPINLSVKPLGVVMPKGLQYSRLRTKVNRAIEDWQASGWLKERATYWGLP